MRAVFLDRDGVIIRKAPEGDYIKSVAEMQVLPGALEAIASLVRAGYAIFIVTNQRGVATGKISMENLHAIHESLTARLQDFGASVTAIYYCPHDASDACSCRKPEPGMLFRAAVEHAVALEHSWMVGDAGSDVQAGKNAGCRTLRIIDDMGTQADSVADMSANSLTEAARLILLAGLEPDSE